MVVKNDTNEVGDADPGLFFSGSNSNIAKATSASGLSLLALDVNLLNPNWSTLKFGNLEITPSLFTSTSSDFYYNVPSSGKYIINLNFKNQTVLSLGVATNSQIGILKTSGSTTSLIDSKFVNAISLALVANYYFETIHSVYEFAAGDKIRFVYNKGALNIGLGLLSNASGSVVLYKIAD